MQRLDLRAAAVAQWRERLSRDFQIAIPFDARPEEDDMAVGLAQELLMTSPRSIARTLVRFAGTLEAIGVTRRMRVLAWAMNLGWPDAAILMRQILNDDDTEPQHPDREKVAAMVLKDNDDFVYALTWRSRQGIGDTETVQAIHVGTREFEASFADLRQGGL